MTARTGWVAGWPDGANYVTVPGSAYRRATFYPSRNEAQRAADAVAGMVAAWAREITYPGVAGWCYALEEPAR